MLSKQGLNSSLPWGMNFEEGTDANERRMPQQPRLSRSRKLATRSCLVPPALLVDNQQYSTPTAG